MPAALSGGMRKRAGLARALALDPPILLVDEPSAGLDPITSDEIDTLLLELKQKGGTTIIVVTHNIPSARRLGDELVMLHEGRILAKGTAADLDQSDNELVRAFMASQSLRVDMANARLAAVGAFVVGGVLLFTVGLFLIGSRRMLFSDTFELYAEFSQIAALDGGAKVRVSRNGRRRSRVDSSAGFASRKVSGADARQERPASAPASRLRRGDSERRSRRQQVRADRFGNGAVSGRSGRGHDSEAASHSTSPT